MLTMAQKDRPDTWRPRALTSGCVHGTKQGLNSFTMYIPEDNM